MITAAGEPGSARGYRVAIVASLAVHLLGVLLYGGVLRPLHLPALKPEEKEFVSLSQAITIDKRKKAVPVPVPPRRVAPPQVPPPQPRTIAQRPVLPQPQIAVPRYEHPRSPETPAPARTARPELAKDRTIKRSRTVSALAGSGAAQARQSAGEAITVPRRRSAYSPQQIASLQQEFSKAIARDRAQMVNPVDVPRATPVAPKRYAVQMDGIHDDLNRGEGLYEVLKRWQRDGWNYYYISYEFVYSDGTYERGVVPWPIRYRPGADPIDYWLRSGVRTRIDIHAPLPDYVLPPNVQLQPLLHHFFPNRYPNG